MPKRENSATGCEIQTITHQPEAASSSVRHRLEDEQPEGRLLWGGADVLEAMEKGLEVLRGGVVEEDEPWPGEESGGGVMQRTLALGLRRQAR